MLSPDPVTQAPENGQNYNRYTYANNNPLRYTDPSGFISEGAPTVTPLDAYLFVTSVINLGKSLLGNSCNADCQWRHQAVDWCHATSSCQNALNQSRQTRDNKDFKNGNNAGLNIPYEKYATFQAGDQTFDGVPSSGFPVVGKKKTVRVGKRTVTDWQSAGGINFPSVFRLEKEDLVFIRGAVTNSLIFGLDRIFNAKNSWSLVKTEYELVQDQIWQDYYYKDDTGSLGRYRDWVNVGEVYALPSTSVQPKILDTRDRTDAQGGPTGGGLVIDEYF